MKFELLPIEVQRTLQGLEYAYRDKMYLLARAAYVLPSQNIERYTDQGTEAQLVVTNALQFAVSLGLRPALEAEEKAALETVLPFLELLSEVASKLATDAVAGVDIDAKVVLLRNTDMDAADLTPARLAQLRAIFL